MNPFGPLVVFLLASTVSAASTPSTVDVERADSTYNVEAAFDVDASPEIVWQVLTDYEGIGKFVSSIRSSTVLRREVDHVVLQQDGVGNAWVISIPMHVVLDVREVNGQRLMFRDLCGKSFSTYEGNWEITKSSIGTRVEYRLKADPVGRQPSLLARSAIRGSVTKLLNEVRREILVRANE